MFARLIELILKILFGDDNGKSLADLPRHQRRAALAIARRSARRYQRYVLHVRNELGPEVFADPNFTEIVRETAEEYAQEFL